MTQQVLGLEVALPITIQLDSGHWHVGPEWAFLSRSTGAQIFAVLSPVPPVWRWSFQGSWLPRALGVMAYVPRPVPATRRTSSGPAHTLFIFTQVLKTFPTLGWSDSHTK